MNCVVSSPIGVVICQAKSTGKSLFSRHAVFEKKRAIQSGNSSCSACWTTSGVCVLWNCRM